MTNDAAFYQDRCNELDAELERTRDELSLAHGQRDDALRLNQDLSDLLAKARAERDDARADAASARKKFEEYHILASEVSRKREQELDRLRAELRRLTMDVDAPAAPWQTWAALIAFNVLAWASLAAVGWVAWRLFVG